MVALLLLTKGEPALKHFDFDEELMILRNVFLLHLEGSESLKPDQVAVLFYISVSLRYKVFLVLLEVCSTSILADHLEHHRSIDATLDSTLDLVPRTGQMSLPNGRVEQSLVDLAKYLFAVESLHFESEQLPLLFCLDCVLPAIEETVEAAGCQELSRPHKHVVCVVLANLVRLES